MYFLLFRQVVLVPSVIGVLVRILVLNILHLPECLDGKLQPMLIKKRCQCRPLTVVGRLR